MPLTVQDRRSVDNNRQDVSGPSAPSARRVDPNHGGPSAKRKRTDNVGSSSSSSSQSTRSVVVDLTVDDDEPPPTVKKEKLNAKWEKGLVIDLTDDGEGSSGGNASSNVQVKKEGAKVKEEANRP
ncbi:hypothetical protein HK102_005587 [Quaeritorhiza haematococci]|nr:hypothetical protein HK102_005587 [Quaeritorhiza haematococci]